MSTAEPVYYSNQGERGRKMSAQERFERLYTPEPNSGCWLWLGAGKRYGSFTNEFGKNESAHRFAYRTLVGPVPDGLTIDHLCRTKMCVNPFHMEPVTIRENCLRKPFQLNQYMNATHCIKGHILDGKNKVQRFCKKCHSDRNREYHQRRKLRNG
jgi:hypothetical protein